MLLLLLDLFTDVGRVLTFVSPLLRVLLEKEEQLSGSIIKTDTSRIIVTTPIDSPGGETTRLLAGFSFFNTYSIFF